jgi:hypothetical protein
MEERGWDPEVRKYFKKILSSFGMGLLWLLACVTAGIYYRLGYRHGQPLINVIIFYVAMTVSFLFLLRYLYKIWK